MHWNNDRNKGECSNTSTKMGPSTIYSTPGETGLGLEKSLVAGFPAALCRPGISFVLLLAWKGKIVGVRDQQS